MVDGSFRQILDGLQTNVYISDTETYEILFMNKAMREAYGLEDPEGNICWQVFQNGQGGPCASCPVKGLLSMEDCHPAVRRQERSALLGRYFENYDVLIPWPDGRRVHMQQSVDITDTLTLNKQATIDELCGVLNRRAGKERLAEAVLSVSGNRTPILVGMLDVNNLKNTNDNFGHKEGDFLLKEITSVLKSRIQPPDFIFRLSGDEFIVVLHEKSEKEGSRFLLDALREAEGLQSRHQKPYEFSFCYGIHRVSLDNTLTAGEIIAKADEQMYLQKLRFRKTRLLEDMEKNPFRHSSEYAAQFAYDSTKLYDALIKSTDEFLYICNMKTGVFRYSPAQVKLFDLPAEIMDNPLPFWKRIVHPEDWERFYKSNMEIGENQMDYHSVEFRARNRDGEYLWLKCRGQLMRDEFGDPVLFAGIMTQLDRQNKIDPLTQLLNQQEFVRACEKKLADPAVEQMGIMIMDIDDFRYVNEMYDRKFGDFVLKAMAQFVQSILPGNASLYKLESDRVGVLVENASASGVEDLYHMIQEKILEERLWPRYDYRPQISAGCAMYPADGLAYSELYKYAEYALQYAKNHGKHRIILFSPDIMEQEIRSFEMMRRLRQSVDESYDGFEAVFQPQVDACTKKVKGAEALLRWKTPQMGAVPPMEFIPILEENELILPVGLWILRKAVRACREWISIDPDFSISVNVSAVQIRDGKFPEDVKRILEEEGLPAGNLVLELTESYTVQNMGSLRHTFDALQELGIRIAMDDFGTGYSSLGILKQAPVDVVKIDRAFVRDILRSKFDATFIRFIVAICHDVCIQVCLEGIETEEEYEVVKEMGLDEIQGYLFGKPMMEKELTERMLFP